MSNAMRFGKRSLAGLASGALLLSGIAIVAAQPAQAAPTGSIYCSGNATGVSGRSNPADASVIQPNCSVIAAPTAVARLQPTTTIGIPAAIGALQLTISSGSAVWATPTGATATTDYVITGSGKVLTVTKSSFANSGHAYGLSVQAVGANTVTVGLSTTSTLADVSGLNTSDGGDLTVTGTGPDAGIIVNQAYKAVDDTTGGTGAALGIIHLVDAQGTPLLPGATPNTRVTFQNVNPAGGSVTARSYVNGDCLDGASAGLLKTADTNINTGKLAYPVPACVVTEAAGVNGTNDTGVWIVWAPSSATKAGAYTSSFTFTAASGRSYTGSLNYTVSSTKAGAWTVAFDKTNYAPGATALVSLCATDLGGRIVPDGLGWASVNDGRKIAAAAFNAPVFSATTGIALTNAEVKDLFKAASGVTEGVTTYGGCAVGKIVVPQTEMVLTFGVTNVAGAGWTAAQAGTSKTASAVIGNPEPTKPTIMIVGERGKGDNLNMVFVEGRTTDMVGKTVTPHFRFPGQTGFTTGTGTRTVDADGNFQWQRKTGKQIAVQFRGEGAISNTFIIPAK